MTDRTSASARHLSLSQACFINPKKSELRLPSKNLPVSFVPMAAVDEQFGCIVDPETRPLGEVEKGFTYFREGDVLLAKITPCMENGKAAIAKGLVNGIGFGSTEFHVLRPKEGVLPEWVYYFVRSNSFRTEAAMRMTGSAGQQRVPVSFLEEKTIPVPPVEEQHHLIHFLQEADSTRRTRVKADERTSQLTQTIFLEIFGDPATNPNDWEMRRLSEIGTLDRGRSRHRPRDAAHLYGGPHPFIQTGDIANSDGFIRSHTQTYSDVGLAQSKLWPAGTLCITIAANIAKTAILTFDACFPDSVVGFTPAKGTAVEYVRGWLVTMEKRLEEAAPQAAQKNINLGILRKLALPVPPPELQRQFADRVKEVAALRQAQYSSSQLLNQLFESLLARTFTGE